MGTRYDTFLVRDMAHGVRCRWRIDSGYETRGNFAYDTEEETKAAEEAEIASLASGEWVALGCIVETFCSHCEEWGTRDSLWGIVIQPDGETLDAFAKDSLDLSLACKTTVAAKIASLCLAIGNCQRTENQEWEIRHTEQLQSIVREHLPSGSGFDGGTQFDVELNSRYNGERLIFDTSFHHMNDGGFYDGWTEHRVTVYPEFEGLRLKIGGRNRNDIKDYMYEVFDGCLTEEIQKHA